MAEPQLDWAKVLRTLRIMIFAMLLGLVVTATAFIIVQPLMANGRAGQPTFITYVLVFVAALMMPLSVLLGRVLTHAEVTKLRTQRERFEPDRDLPPVYFRGAIVSIALLEAGSLKCLVAFLLEGEVFALIAAGALAAFITMYWPTFAGVESWQIEKTRQIRSASLKNHEDWPTGEATL